MLSRLSGSDELAGAPPWVTFYKVFDRLCEHFREITMLPVNMLLMHWVQLPQ